MTVSQLQEDNTKRYQVSYDHRSYKRNLSNCLNCVYSYDDHSLLDFKSAVQYMKHFIYHFTPADMFKQIRK